MYITNVYIRIYSISFFFYSKQFTITYDILHSCNVRSNVEVEFIGTTEYLEPVFTLFPLSRSEQSTVSEAPIQTKVI